MVSVTIITSFLLVIFASQAAAIGPCNHDLIQKMMDINNKNCIHHFLDKMYNISTVLRVRVVNKKLADLYSCFTVVSGKPVDNVAVAYNKNTYRDTSRGFYHVNFTIVEARCGLFYKYIAEEKYKSFTLLFGWTDGISVGFWGCTDETDNPFYDKCDIYVVCQTLTTEDTEEVTASLTKCRDYMANLTGATDLVVLPYCDNDNEYRRGRHCEKKPSSISFHHP